MKKSDFLKEMQDMLEITSVDNLSEETVIRELPEYNSLFVLSIIAFVDDNFSIQLSAEQLKNLTTVKNLMELIGLEKFEN